METTEILYPRAMPKENRDSFAVEVGRRLAAVRAAAGFSQIEFARRLGLPTAANLSNWENGWSMLAPHYIPQILALTGATSDYLYLGDTIQLPRSLYEKLFPSPRRRHNPTS